MKIRVVKEVPVNILCQPRVGQIYEVENVWYDAGCDYPVLYHIRVHGFRVGIYFDEMELVEE